MVRSKPVFPNYTQLPQIVPQPVWYVARLLTVGISFGIILTLFIRPDIGLLIFWRLTVPLLPILFFVAPGLWRNICPMAALNQTPRLFKFTRGIALSEKAKSYAYVVGITLFFIIVPTRKALFNTNGPALGVLLIAVYATAFLGGYIFKGKSGWCSSICPLLPVQRLYGQTPLVLIPNNHCKPCVGCAKNCYDFNPLVANMADQYDSDKHYTNYRRLFAGVFPGLILAFYIVPNPPQIDVLSMYGQVALYMLFSLGAFFALDTFLRITPVQIVTLYGVLALNLYYYFNLPLFADTLDRLFHIPVSQPVILGGHLVILILSVAWIVRTALKEPLFVAQSLARPSQVKSSVILRNSMLAQQAKVAGNPEVTFEPDNKRVLVAAGKSILEVAEANNMPIEAGCRMGVCGADPVAIKAGMEHLSPAAGDEQSTLDRLGLAENTRMACCARIQGPVSVALKPERPGAIRRSVISGFKYDKSIKKVVVIGNGIAGVTAADHVRRRNPECEIYVIGREKHPLYNRMGLSRLIYGRTAMQGLYLMADSWYEEHQITSWLNTRVVGLDRDQKSVKLADGEVVPYDRLILAMGSASTVPSIEGYGLPGSFVLREADDAMQIRYFVQEHGCTNAVVAGGGLLGLEAAYAMRKLGMEVAVLERSKWPMRRQLDEKGGQFLLEYLAGLGIRVIPESEIAQIKGTGRVRHAILKDGQDLPCDLFLVCAGVKPNVELAQVANLEIKQGVIVDDHMRTSDPNIYAAGDIAEYGGTIYGLWPIAVEQAEVAATNAIGGEKTYVGSVPTTMLKVAGVDLMSIGQFDAKSPDDEVIALENAVEHRYRKLVINGGKIVGAILLGYPTETPLVNAAIKEQRDISAHLNALRDGKWTVLEGNK